MASYFEERNVNENEETNDRIQRLTRETFRMIFDQDPYQYDNIVNNQITPPASKSEIDKLKIVSHDKLLGEQCPICLSPYQLEQKALTMPCDHVFHEECLKTWLKKSNFCPLCKLELGTDNELYELYKKELKNRQIRERNIEELHNSMFS
ncbi:Zinc finger, RING-type,Zinc finger, RING-CH-type,Zinc finger, RING/FYVE/PHD-type [Cinara cedri]|uniref:Zinc finger, RING-type,Zinc finger, RING-CH-type,Zinc finger, RING/FYVE/PHD-type n=1 Tax=Cinara cedri TaxID=506608 RepID=A0A5E4MZW5_9HEMI|nr:Zinc finger, RING-type,Zinc finger, RING-CH-type,Zinc finger, RING/FYVE/PHD-type [Cinara cedri]